MTPNLDAMGHQWVSALAWFNFELEYQKGHDNTLAEALSWVTTWLDPDTVRSILDEVTFGTAHQAKVYDPAIVEGDHHLEQEVHVATGCTLVQMHVTGWAEGPNVEHSVGLAEGTEEDRFEGTSSRMDLQQRRLADLRELPEFYNSLGALYLHTMPKGETEDLLFFMVPRTHCVTTLNGCHRDADHQGCDHTLSLLWECFWWPGMDNQVQQSIKSCVHCLQHGGKLSKAPLHLILATALMDLLHVDFTSIEMTLDLNRLPKVANVLVFQDHFMKHIMAYVTPNQTAKTVSKFLYQGYISISGAPARLLSDWGANFWAASLMRCVNSLEWRNCKPYLTTPRWMGWWRGLIKPLCGWLGSWEKTKRPTGQDNWLK